MKVIVFECPNCSNIFSRLSMILEVVKIKPHKYSNEEVQMYEAECLVCKVKCISDKVLVALEEEPVAIY